MRLLVLSLFLSAGLAVAGEYAVLASGARLRVDRHEIEGTKVRLHVGQGYTEMEAALIQCFEAELQPEAVPTLPNVPAAPAKTQTPLELADAAADRYGLPRGLIRSIMAAESGNQAGAVSPKGAIGLMQLMPATARDLGADPNDPVQNVDAGARYLRDLLIKYNYGLWHALAAYNAGPGAVDKYNSVPPYRETIHYINRISKSMQAAEAKAAGEVTP